MLLAPSIGLVKKHWDRLPIGDYVSFLAYEPLPIRTITPSNQLSYVIRFNYAEQNILVTGDTGFVDFRPGRTQPYYQRLIDTLSPLHVIQVAHHAGANAHFYNGLLASNYKQQKERSYLLLSHAVNDPHRPSDLFGKFIEQIQRDTARVLFTSQPLEKFVRDFRSIIHQLAGTKASDRGDICLKYGNSKWEVTKHSIEVQ